MTTTVVELQRLEQSGAGETEIERSRREIAGLLWRLAEIVRHREPDLTQSS